MDRSGNTGFNAWPFFIDSSQHWDKQEIKAILDTHGIVMGGWGYSQGYFMFCVKKVHARWAEYLLLKQNVPIRGRLLTNGHQPREATEVEPMGNNEQIIDKRTRVDQSVKPAPSFPADNLK